MKISYFLIILASLILLYLLWDNRHIFNKIEKLPPKYESYQNIASGVETESYTIQPLHKEKFEEIEIVYFNSDDNTVVVRTKNYTARPIPDLNILLNKYYKLNIDGVVIDSFSLADTEISEIYEGYLVNNDSYYLWLLNGDKTKYPCEIINRDKTLSKDEIHHQLITLHEKASLVKYHSVGFSQTFLFFINNKWVILLGSNPYDSENKYAERHIEKTMLPNLINEEEVWNKESNYLNLVHFQKKSFSKRSSSGWFNPIHHVIFARWNGEGYMQLNFKNDTIPFKMNLEHLKKDPPNKYEIPFRKSLSYFTADDLNYGLFSTADKYNLFLVKKK